MRTTKQNPFAITESRSALGRRRALWSWSGLLCLVAFLIAGIWFLPDAFDWWSTRQLATGLAGLPAIEQHARLDALSRLGEPGLRALVNTMLSADEPVAQAAFEVLSETQQEVHFRAGEEAGLWHSWLMNAIEQSRAGRDLAPSREAWIEQLARETLSETLSGKTFTSRRAYATAVRLLATKNNPRAGLVYSPPPLVRPSVVDLGASSDSLNLLDPLPTDAPNQVAQPTADSPQQVAQPLAAVQREEPTRTVGRLAVVVPTEVPPNLQRSTWQSPKTRAHSEQGNEQLPTQIFSVDGSLEPYSTRDVIDLLVGASDALTLAARRELTRRGFSTADLAAATQLASPDPKKRLTLIANLGRHGDIDPRPFLIWLCRDEDREVRLAAINALATMSDPLARRSLQELLTYEADPTVASQIRVALGIKSR